MNKTFVPYSTICLVVLVFPLAGATCDFDSDEEIILLAVSNREIPEDQALAFVFTPESTSTVTISVQASNDLADPKFTLVAGEVDFQDLDETPIADLILIADDGESGQEIDDFRPQTNQPYTVFIEDVNDVTGAKFSITISQ